MFSTKNSVHILRAARVAAAVGLCFISQTQAATIVWSSVQTITSNLDIQNPSSVIVARNYGNAAGNINVAVGPDTVTFVPASSPFNATSNDGSYFDASGTLVGADFESVLDSFAFSYTGDGAGGTGTETLPFSGLTAGGTYLLQVFTSDDRPYTWNTQLDIGGSTQTIYTSAGTSASTFANATIVLGAGETSFNLIVTGLTNGPGGSSNNGLDLALVNAVVLSQAVPEPSTFLLTLLGLAGLVASRRRLLTPCRRI